MKLKFMVFCLVSICVYGDFLAMKIEMSGTDTLKKSQVKNLDLSDIKVDIGEVDQEDGVPFDTIQLIYEAFLAKKMAKGKVSGLHPFATPRQAVLPLKNELTKQVEALQETDPELYTAIMNFKKEAEDNGKTTREIEGFIKQNLAQLPEQVNTKTMYKHLYNAQAATIESKKKKDYALHEVLAENEPVNLPTLLHTLLYRSASVQFGKEQAQQEVEKHTGYLDQWLTKVQETEPEMYAILMQAYEQLKNKNVNQQSAIPQLINAVDQIRPEVLQLLLKDIQRDQEVKNTVQTTTSSVWTSASKVIGLLIAAGTLITTGTGGTFAALFGASKTAALCTVATCVAMNITNCTNITG